jgi:hypothetical protein
MSLYHPHLCHGMLHGCQLGRSLRQLQARQSIHAEKSGSSSHFSLAYSMAHKLDGCMLPSYFPFISVSQMLVASKVPLDSTSPQFVRTQCQTLDSPSQVVQLGPIWLKKEDR